MVFQKYAQYYDLLYQDKDYQSESGYVISLINKFQKEKHLTTVTDNDNAAVKEDDHVENIAVEGKVAAPPAPSSLTDLSAMPPLPPKANTTTQYIVASKWLILEVGIGFF